MTVKSRPIYVVGRVSTSNRLPQNLKTTKTKEAEDDPQPTASDVYSTTAQNLKKMRDRIAKAQMPNEDVGKEQKLFALSIIRMHART